MALVVLSELLLLLPGEEERGGQGNLGNVTIGYKDSNRARNMKFLFSVKEW